MKENVKIAVPLCLMHDLFSCDKLILIKLRME